MTLRYYIPDWDDRVDPGYDFLVDAHTVGRDPYRDDYYAHQIYHPAPYDGILLSRATLDENQSKRAAIVAAGSVHRYLRLPVDGKHTVLGDCGAFTYWKEHAPPYETPEMLEYYQALGFDLGVAIDHLIFAEHDDEKERRWQITIQNDEDFLTLHKRGGYTFTPIGVAQGWDPLSYQRATKALMQMGYTYIAIGGLVRSQTQEILRILHAVQPELRPDTQVHLFGVSRPEHAQTFASLGVTSFDSASRLRRAWMDGRRNYFLGDESFTAIRIPDARLLARKKNLEQTEALRLEQEALRFLRAYDCGEATIEETHCAVSAYAAVAGDMPARIHHYLYTLERQPWKHCPCAICRAIGIEVIIFRGNNRNRRRGFHNTWQLYQQLQLPDEDRHPSSLRTRQLEMQW